ncbi:hypothetical protein [Streptomyces cellulosae]|uniref:Uncharacterized protein n=1 Tax=Streptomyces cellulosae TaxID=1968 RepID=A0ABW7YHN5_STRCE
MALQQVAGCGLDESGACGLGGVRVLGRLTQVFEHAHEVDDDVDVHAASGGFSCQAFPLVVGAVDQLDPVATVSRVALSVWSNSMVTVAAVECSREASIRRGVVGGLLPAPSVKVPLLESFMAAAAGALVLPAFQASPSP